MKRPQGRFFHTNFDRGGRKNAKEMKDLLGWVFGTHNDFEAIFCGVNIMGVAGNGERVITNFIHAVKPILESGARKCAKQQVNSAVGKAKMNRAQRRAAGKR